MLYSNDTVDFEQIGGAKRRVGRPRKKSGMKRKGTRRKGTKKRKMKRRKSTRRRRGGQED